MMNEFRGLAALRGNRAVLSIEGSFLGHEPSASQNCIIAVTSGDAYSNSPMLMQIRNWQQSQISLNLLFSADVSTNILFCCRMRHDAGAGNT